MYINVVAQHMHVSAVAALYFCYCPLGLCSAPLLRSQRTIVKMQSSHGADMHLLGNHIDVRDLIFELMSLQWDFWDSI